MDRIFCDTKEGVVPKKSTIFCTLLLLVCFGCASKESKHLTQHQKDQIKDEVKAVCESLMGKMNKLDAEGSFQYYADSPDWVWMNADGSRLDYQTAKKMWNNLFNPPSPSKWTIIRQDLIVLAQDIVICLWVGTWNSVIKTGDEIIEIKKIEIKEAYTLIFKKIAGQWKIIYSHASG
jgi:ketosteroid isomerase-like protein